MREVAFLILFITLAANISGIPSAYKKECNRPFITVMGDHYDVDECVYSFPDTKDVELLKEKYIEMITSDSSDKNYADSIWELILNFLIALEQSIEQKMFCLACSSGVKLVWDLKGENVSRSKIFEITQNICKDLRLFSPMICDGMVDTYGDVLLEVFENANKTSSIICNYITGIECAYEPVSWNVTFPKKEKPPIAAPSPPLENAKNLKVLQITDTHWDMEYAEGSWAECKAPLCCRSENMIPNEGGTRAGKFGGWKCDIPETTLDSMLEDIKKRHPDIDYVIWTGDLPAHDLWSQNRSKSLDILHLTVAKLKAAFPKMPIFPALGNHESVPQNLFPFIPENGTEDENPMKWLYDELDIEWSEILPGKLSDTIRYGAFFTTLIRPGFRLVSLNMNFCYNMNWWLAINDTDPLRELHWLIKVLQSAEENKEQVHIIGHISPGDTKCLKTWQTNYYRIISRYENTVTAQFFGHSHNDRFELYFDEETGTRAVGVGYVAPSLTTYTYLNPAYRIYQIEGDAEKSKRFVLDHETWYLDLEKANAEERATWQKLYSAKSDFNMNSLYPEDWNKIYQKMFKEEKILEKYHKYYWKGSPKRPKHCNELCKKTYKCEIRSCVQYGRPKQNIS